MQDELTHADGWGKSVMVALLPTTTYWSNLQLPHLTLVYVGEIEDLKFTVFNDLAKTASAIATMSTEIKLEVLTKDVYGGGEEPAVDVFIMRPTPELIAMRKFFEIWNASQHPFSPHVTVGKVGEPTHEQPNIIRFDRIAVVWGNEQLVFTLKPDYSDR